MINTKKEILEQTNSERFGKDTLQLGDIRAHKNHH